ncbi:hypothetical protein HPB50_022377 [Hyalomma asiaticum]|uniref:Uncharacterized protein n=1 Tax=Hyalomma asiaticum TaxID=266040 RepID=A0ACB7S3E8_HYAAI|nr:hypothetical protein HPB50_022377 [Hyalomma asiaticum]
MSQLNVRTCHASLAIERSSGSLRKAEWTCGDDPPFGNGRFQLASLLNVAIAAAAYILHYESFRITAGVMDHWCRRPEAFANLSVKQTASTAAAPVREAPFGGANNRVVPCTSWEFDLDKYGNNAVSQWALVCGRAWLISLARLVYAAACIVSTPLVSRLADRAGRKLIVFGTIPVIIITGVASSLPNGFHIFVAVRAVVSAATSSAVPPLFSIFWEVSPPSQAPLYCIGFIVVIVVITDSALATAEALKSGWATVQLILMVPTFLMVALYFTVEESPSWLVATGRAAEAERVSLHLAKINGVAATRCRELFALQLRRQSPDATETVEQSNACSTRLRRRTILIVYMWVAFGYAHDSYVTTDGIPVSGPVKVIVPVACLCGCLLCARWVRRIGPKSTVVVNGLVFSASLAALTATSVEDETFLRNVFIVVTKVSGYCTLSNFCVLTILLYPTTTHCAAAAIAVISNRVGDTLAQMSTVLIGPKWHLGNGLSLAAAALAFFVIAGAYLPDEPGTGACQVRVPDRRRSSAGEELKRAFRETLKPLRVKRSKLDDKKTRRKSMNFLTY